MCHITDICTINTCIHKCIHTQIYTQVYRQIMEGEEEFLALSQTGDKAPRTSFKAVGIMKGIDL